MVIKMDTIDGAHAANAINYVLDKEKARKEDKPVFLAANNIELNPLTGKPYSPVKAVLAYRTVSAAGGLSGLDDGAVEQVLQGLCGGAGRYPLQMGAGEGQGRQACHRQKNGTTKGQGERQTHHAG